MRKTIFILFLCFASCSLRHTYAQNLYIGSFYVTTTDEEKLYGDGGDKWANRRPIICDMFNFEQPDVLGLQSATTTQITQMMQRLSNYTAAGDILFNKTTVQMDSCGVVDDMPEGNTCSWARLQMGERSFYVFNVCLSTDASVGSTAAARVVNAIAEINTDNLFCFVIGDLGTNEKKAAYARLSIRYVDCYKQAPVVSAEYGTKSDFDLAANHGTDRFDFIFAPRNVSVQAYGQLQYAYFTTESDGSHKRRQLSTHFPVMAKVTFP